MKKDTDNFSILNDRLNGNLVDGESILKEETMTKKEKKSIEKENRLQEIKETEQKKEMETRKEQEHMTERVNYDVNNLQKVINASITDDEEEEKILEKTVNDVFVNLNENIDYSLKTKDYDHKSAPVTPNNASNTSKATLNENNTVINKTEEVETTVSQINNTKQPEVYDNQYNIPTNNQINQPVNNVQPPVQPLVQSQIINPVQAPINPQQYSQEELIRANKKKERELARKKKNRSKLLSVAINWLIRIAVLGVMFGLVFTFVIGKVTISGESMQPTYYDNDIVVYDKLSINFKNPQRNDVILFYKNDTYYIKRIIGMPGDTIVIDKEGKIIINGEEYKEELPYNTILDGGIATEEVKLGINEFFVLGDNRNISLDSRSSIIGNVSKNEIKGIVLFSISGGIKEDATITE